MASLNHLFCSSRYRYSVYYHIGWRKAKQILTFEKQELENVQHFSDYLIILWRIGRAGSGGELCWVVWSRSVLSHEGHPTGGVRGWGGAPLLWTSGVLQRLVRVPRHPSRAVLLHWKTLQNNRDRKSYWTVLTIRVYWEAQSKEQVKSQGKQKPAQVWSVLQHHETLSHLISLLTNIYCC